jgi:asparagine synthase (glutamine-hydrolysing)
MCGFAGVIAWETLSRMSAAIAHRGPDGEGFHLNHDQQITPDHPQVGLAFRRLAILDPDPRSNQPFTDGRHWMVFNGEIYNFRELKKELSILKPDYPWQTTGDTEVLLCAYAVWGEKCVEHLNGMFAFAVWDEIEKSLFLARDRMGQKPLFYVLSRHGRIIFSSEISGIRAVVGVEGEIFPEGMLHYLQYGTREALGFFGDIHEVTRSETLLIGAGGRFLRPLSQYFSTAAEFKADRKRANVRELVGRAVERQLVSDVPLGVFLSGGIDSSVIAACARAHGRISTFSIRFDDKRYDESQYATQVARHLDTDHNEFHVTPDAAADLPRLARLFGDPFGDSSALPTHYLCRETRKHVKVALSGDGGDELFGGYDRYRAMKIPRFFSGFGLLSPIGKAIAGGPPKSGITRIGRFLSLADKTAAERYQRLMQIFDDATIHELVPHSPCGIHHGIELLFEDLKKRGFDDVQSALAVDRATYLPNDLLTKVDRCSMRHGLEVRSPFMDHELVEFAAGLTTDQLLRGGPKRMLREAFAADLPAWVFKRKKMGFAVPIGDWFRGPLRGMLRDTLFSAHAFGRSHFDMKVVERLVDEHESKRIDHSQRLYALLMLELWWNTVRT